MAGLEVWAQNGTQLIGATTSVILQFGIITIGGVGAPQSGAIADGRFGLGRPYFFQLLGGIPGYDNREAVISISGTTLSWNFPEADGSQSANRPSTTILYGTF